MKLRDAGATILIVVAVYWVVSSWTAPKKCYAQYEVDGVVVGDWSKENCKKLEGVKE